MTVETERLFFAVELSNDVRYALAAFVADHAGDHPLPGRPVAPENWHITLRFLGRTEPAQRDVALAEIDRHLQQGPFILGFEGLGAFPRPGHASVLWLGIGRGAGELDALAMRCEDAAQAAGFAPEDRPFHPHVTLSRLRPWQDLRPLVERFPVFPRSQTVEGITLFRSIPGRGGARYEIVDMVPLAS